VKKSFTDSARMEIIKGRRHTGVRRNSGLGYVSMPMTEKERVAPA